MKHRNLRKALAQISARPAGLLKHAPQLCRAVVGTLGEMREAGAPVTSARRDELLVRCAAGEHVEIDVDILAYEQRTGERNRNSVRFKDSALKALGRSGRGTPFLRDHNQHDSLSKAGVVLASATESADGAVAIRQTVRLTAPWAVEMALRGLMDAVSIGWRPTGPVLCSACNAPVYTKCWHWPGDRLVEEEAEGGGKRKVRAADGPIVVEWIYTAAELVETSVVNVGGVPTARVEDVRAAMFASLSAGNPSLRSEVERQGFDIEQENDMDPELLKLLGLSETATEEEVKAAVAKLKESAKEGAVKGTELAITQKDFDAVQAKLAALEAEQRKTAEASFIADALSSGRITKANEAEWRALYQLDAKRAGELMAKREEGSASPVNQPRQAASDPDQEPQPIPELREVHVEGGGVPGFTLYERGQRSKVERKEIARALSAAVKALETHPNPKAAWWAERMGFDGRLRMPSPTLSGGTAIAGSADLDAARTAFRAAFMQSLEMASVSPLEMLYTTVPTNTPLARIHWMGDLPGFEEWVGDRKMSGVEAFKLDLESKKWSNGLRVKNDDVKFDTLGLMPQQIGGLATKARRHRLDRMAGMMIDGFAGGTTSNGLAYDGAFFFADAHRGGNDNKLAVALDAANLAAAELQLESMTTYDGQDALDTHGSHLIVGPKLRATAEKLLTQERLANGEDNYHRGKYKLIVENRFRGAADDYWFLGDLSHEIKPFIFQLVEEITTSAIMGQEANNSMPSFMNDELLFGAQANYNMSYFEFRLMVGSVVA